MNYYLFIYSFIIYLLNYLIKWKGGSGIHSEKCASETKLKDSETRSLSVCSVQ